MILAIDPGSKESGYVIADPLNKEKPVHEHGHVPNRELLETIWRGTLPEGRGAYNVVIEDFEPWSLHPSSHQQLTVLWTGQFMAAVEYAFSAQPTLLRRKEVCYWLTGDPNCKTVGIRRELIDRYGPGQDKAIGTKKLGYGPLHGMKAHEFDALALAIVHAEQAAKKG